MSADPELLLDIVFEAEVIHWRGPSPFFFVAIPPQHIAEVRHAARSVSYSWGVVPVEAAIGALDFRTSLFPKEDSYLLPLKDAVRKKADIALGDMIGIQMKIHAGRP